MKRVFAACCIFLSGCAVAPVGPQNRADWAALHTHRIHDAQEKDVLDAAQRVLQLADHDFKFDFPPGQLQATRSWSIYMVLAAAFGTDYWNISAAQVGQDVDVTVQISRQAGTIAPTPTVGVTGPGAGGIGATAGATTMPGQSVPAPFPYDLFWSRLDYQLGRSTTWLNCSEAKAGKTSKQKMGSEVICGAGIDDKAPPPRP